MWFFISWMHIINFVTYVSLDTYQCFNSNSNILCVLRFTALNEKFAFENKNLVYSDFANIFK